MEHILDRKSDFIFITETWMKSEKCDLTAKFKEYGYTLRHQVRRERDKELGGGVGILIKSSLIHKPQSTKQFSSFEHVIVKLSLVSKKTLILICIYRLSFISVVTFLDEFVKLLEIFIATGDTFIIAGDVNIHVETEELYAIKFNEILHIFNLNQHVIGPTHRLGHTLDVVITNTDESFINNIEITEFGLSDHFLIDFYLNSEVDHKEYNTIIYRKINEIKPDTFCKDINGKKVSISNANNMKQKVDVYNKVMEIVDDHAPLKTKTIKIVELWFDKDYADLRRKRRLAEKKDLETLVFRLTKMSL